MPKIYPKRIRRKFASLNLEKVKESLKNKGFEYCRDGGFRKEDEPLLFVNYLFYQHPETKMAIRVGYGYPLIIGDKNLIFEICYANEGDEWWTDVVPNFSKDIWKEVSDWYEKGDAGKFKRISDK